MTKEDVIDDIIRKTTESKKKILGLNVLLEKIKEFSSDYEYTEKNIDKSSYKVIMKSNI